MEPIFNVGYLTTVITLGITMLTKSKYNQYFRLFGSIEFYMFYKMFLLQSKMLFIYLLLIPKLSTYNLHLI